MAQDSIVMQIAARMARVPFALFARRPYVPPQKALILHPCCLSHVMLATPLLATLSQANPKAQFDWAISDWARPAIVTNPRITQFIRTGEGPVDQASRNEIQELTQRIRAEQYDTCFIPHPSAKLAQIAWRAGIPQRIGIHSKGSGFANTTAVSPPKGEQHAATVYLSLAQAIGINPTNALPAMEFYPKDAEYTAVTQRLIDQVNWLGDQPLVILHPGGGQGSATDDPGRRWPLERFVLLGNHIIRKHKARIIVVGSNHDYKMAQSIVGMMSGTAVNWSGKITLGELGALCELATLYVGNDTGPTHIAAAMGCATIAIYGSSDPQISSPYSPQKGNVVVLSHAQEERPYKWENGVTVKEASKAADQLLQQKITLSL